jgi:hypothetical protein
MENPKSSTENMIPSLFIKDPIIPAVTEEIMIIGLYDDSLIYTPLKDFKIETIIEKYPSIWSGYLEKKPHGEMYALTSKTNDRRKIEDRLMEYLKIICILVYMTTLRNIKRKITIEVSDQYLPYIPKRYFREVGGAWSCPIEIKDLISVLLNGSLTKLLDLPRSDLPYNVKMYLINNQAVHDMLHPFFLLEDKIIRFLVYDKGKAEILNADFKEIKNIALPETIRNNLDLILETNNNLIAVQAWKSDSSNPINPKIPSYEIAIAFYVHLKAHFKERIMFENFLPTPLGIKTIRNTFWAPNLVVETMIKTNLFNPKLTGKALIIPGKSTTIGKTNFTKWTLTEDGLKIVRQVFGKGITSTEFRVRPFNKAEIVTDDIHVFELVKEMFERGIIKIKILEKTFESLAFEGDYFTIMKIYFTIKLIRGATLISEINPLEHVIGQDALRSIAERTPFGDLHIIKTIKDNQIQVFLSSKHPEAINSLLFAVNEDVKFSIILQEIEKGVLARKLTGPSIYYVFYALDQMPL